jgi:hypothetical protein
VFNATFNNISVISWRSVLLVEETGVPMSVVCLNTGYLSFLRIPMDGILINFSVLGAILGEILNVSVFYSNSQFIVTSDN